MKGHHFQFQACAGFKVFLKTMLSKKEPVFRKVIIPWYHSKTAYIFVIILMLAVILFGMIGISVAGEIAEYRGYLWVPVLLAVLSAVILISATYRLIKRYLSRPLNTTLE
jgi:hypothetical protein